jgi:KipI family sensor histidine kinase inhibitor
MGEAAALVEVADPADVLALDAGLRATRPPGVTDLVPAARTVLVRFDPAVISLPQIVAWAEAARPVGDGPALTDDAVEIAVHYTGPDLEDVARLTRMSAADVIAAHAATVWRVAFCGFSPGFGYLVGDAAGLTVPRRASPRANVPAGSVALAGGYTGVYPRASPGGWQVIGRTDAVLWDPDQDPPALFRPGVRVRFRALP